MKLIQIKFNQNYILISKCIFISYYTKLNVEVAYMLTNLHIILNNIEHFWDIL